MPLFNPSSTQGLWTPTITFATPGDLAVTYTTQAGRWRRFAGLVFLELDISTTTFTHTTASGALIINGSPFSSTQPTGETDSGPLNFEGITKAGYTNFVLRLAGATSAINVMASGSGVTVTQVAAADMPTGGAVRLRGNIFLTV